MQDALTVRLAGSDDDLASFVQFVLVQGRDLLVELDRDEKFRERFRGELWPKLIRVVTHKDEALEFYLDVPYLWQLLALDRGEELLARRGLLAVALLFGPDAYPKDFHDRAIKLLLAGDGVTFQGLTEGKFRKDALFIKLMNREVPGAVIAAALNKLFESGENYRSLLEKYNGLDNELLAKEVGPSPEGIQTWLPFYTHYMIARKCWEGRDPSAEEWIEAGVDTAIDVGSFFFPPVKAGGKVAAKGGKTIVTQSLKTTAMMSAGKKLTQKGAEQIAKKGMERQIVRWGVTGIFSKMQESFRKLTAKSMAFEISSPVQFFYKHSNFGRESFKRMSGLEARVFMRKDAKVFIHVDRLIYDRAKNYLNGWLKDKANEAITEAMEEQNWKQHVSAWWLMNTGDSLHSSPK